VACAKAGSGEKPMTAASPIATNVFFTEVLPKRLVELTTPTSAVSGRGHELSMNAVLAQPPAAALGPERASAIGRQNPSK
jgi:hypothetical protein